MSDVSIAVNTVALITFTGILAGRFSDRHNFPHMVPLIIIGMIYSSLESPAFIAFDDEGIKDIALVMAELALILVLYNEGMHLNLRLFRQNLLPVFLLAVVGTLITVSFVALVLTYLSGFSSFSITLFGLTALLTASIVVPTDPAATFAILKNSGGNVKARIETILGGESAVNDITAILLVIVVFIPRVLEGDDDPINSSDIILEIGQQLFGGILLGITIGVLTLSFISRAKTTPEYAYYSASGALAVFIFAPTLGASAAISALVAGIIVKNPNFVFMKKNYEDPELFNFWEYFVYIIEIFSFVTIGILFRFSDFQDNALIGIGLSLIVIISRLISVYISTLPLEASKFTKEILSNKERFFIAIAGFRGLTSAVLALIAYISIVNVDPQLADIILYSSLSLILISGTIQGLVLPFVTDKTGVSEA